VKNLSFRYFALIILCSLFFWAMFIQAKEIGKTITCDESKPKLVKVNFGRLTVINFPITPKEIMPGENVFDFKQIKTDLAIKALKPNARTNIFVYMHERRCSFNLITVSSGGDDILYVRDPRDQQIEVKF
jgi:hypothetical protein